MKRKIIFLSLITLFFFPLALWAQEVPVKLLEPLPGITSGQALDFPSVMQNLFRVLLGVGAILAVLMLTIGGIQYMVGETMGSKEAARSRITNAVLGLLLLFGSVLILQTINPNLLKFKIGIPPSSGPAREVSPVPTPVPVQTTPQSTEPPRTTPTQQPSDPQPGESAAPGQSS